MSRRHDLVTGAACAVIGMVAAALMLYAMDPAQPEPTPTVTVTAPSWADGCTTDADCATWDTPTDSVPVTTLPDSCDVTFEGDEEHLYPCVDHPIESITGPEGDLHNSCAVVLISAEDSLAVCADGTEWPS
jgi:hypothetical protein